MSIWHHFKVLLLSILCYFEFYFIKVSQLGYSSPLALNCSSIRLEGSDCPDRTAGSVQWPHLQWQENEKLIAPYFIKSNQFKWRSSFWHRQLGPQAQRRERSIWVFCSSVSVSFSLACPPMCTAGSTAWGETNTKWGRKSVCVCVCAYARICVFVFGCWMWVRENRHFIGRIHRTHLQSKERWIPPAAITSECTPQCEFFTHIRTCLCLPAPSIDLTCVLHSSDVI